MLGNSTQIKKKDIKTPDKLMSLFLIQLNQIIFKQNI